MTRRREGIRVRELTGRVRTIAQQPCEAAAKQRLVALESPRWELVDHEEDHQLGARRSRLRLHDRGSATDDDERQHGGESAIHALTSYTPGRMFAACR